MKMSLRSKCALFVGTVLCAASVFTARASSSLITFSVDMAEQTNSIFNPDSDIVSVQGTYNNWASFTQLFEVGNTTVYTNTVDDTYEANGISTHYQFVINNGPYETSADFNLRALILPTNSGGSVIAPTPFFDDAGPHITNDVTFQVDMSQQISLGNFTNGVNTVEVQGNFNGWTAGAGTLTNNPAILRTNAFGLVTSNVYVGTFSTSASTNAAMDFKYVIQPFNPAHYESPSSLVADNGGNRFFVESVPLTLPVVNFSDQPFAPIAQVTFSVDMSAVLISDPTFETNSVTLDGDFNSWSVGIPCTNNPAAANTNIYSATISVGEGAAVNYQFRYQSSVNGTVYDNPTGGGNRYFVVPALSVVNVPVVFFDDINVSDLLNVDTTVLFSVNMTNAQSFTTGNPFNPDSDTVYINGDFIGWPNWDPISLANEVMTNNPPGSEVYSFSYLFPKGHARVVNYKYSIDGSDDEAGFGLNHVRYIRSTNGVYTMPLDKFGTQTVEQKFGNLAIGRPSGGNIPLTWLGYPGVLLQSTTNLASGSWQNLPATTSLSSTNLSTSGPSTFFRLVQPQ